MIAPLEMHVSGFLTASSQAPKVFTLRGMPGGGGEGGVRELTFPRPHDLHGGTVPHDFLSIDPPHWGSVKRAALLWV
jgi:hypothetical protein